MSFAQQRLWFLDRLEPGNTVYSIPRAFSLKGVLNVPALEQSLNTIVGRHEALRTTFSTVDDEPVQVIHPTADLTLSVVTFEDLSEPQKESECQRLATEAARRPFDLAHGPLFRATLLRLGAQEHVLLLNMHHIVTDGWSLGVLFRELSALYAAFSNGKPSTLSELPVQYADFAVWQRQWLAGEVLDQQLSYWTRQLAESPPGLDLPIDHPRPHAETFRGARELLVLPKELTEALRGLGQREGATLFMTLLAGLQTLLYRYTGEENIVVGSPIAGRNWPEIEGLIGFFVNTLVLRTDLSGDVSFRELLSRVREVCLGAYAHQDLPFERLVEELQLERDLSRNPLVQVMFVLQTAPTATLDLPNVVTNPTKVRVAAETAKFDLTLTLVDGEEGLVGSWQYNTDLFERATIRRLLAHHQRLLEAVVEQPDHPVSRLPLLTEAERHELVVKWNETKQEPLAGQSLHELFEGQVARSPDGLAVAFEAAQITYAELNRRANQLAHHLRELGVGQGVLVGICMERSVEMVVGLLGIMKAGGAYVPLDPEYPKERLAFMLGDSEVALILSQQRLLGRLPEGCGGVVSLDADWEAIARHPDTDPMSGTEPGEVVYVIYTSGSTGKPKGVPVPHGAMVNFLLGMAERPGMTAEDRCLGVTTLSFDIAGLELFLPLVVGGCTTLVSREAGVDARELMERLGGATVMQATPATWRLLLEGGWDGGDELRILCGGEALGRDLAEELLERGVCLWNLYGPTETTIWSTAHEVSSSQGAVPIGKPIANTQIYIVDGRSEPVAIGIGGELYIGGDGIARGYLNRAELTAEKFVPDSFGGHAGKRLYRTADLARYRSDGNIEFLGRIDHQVKIRGFRIELGEIETVLGQHPAVQEVVVLTRRPTTGDGLLSTGEQRLVAYLVAEEPEPRASDLGRFLQEKLPDYMIPSVFVLLDALPLTPNGKVNRRALPAPEEASMVLEQRYVAPRTALEKLLAEIWVEVLEVERVGIHDNFFTLGGHSLLAMRVMTRLLNLFQLELPLRMSFEAPTIATFAAAIVKRTAHEIDWDQFGRALEEVEFLAETEV